MMKGFSKRLSSMSQQLAYIHATGAPNSVIVFFLSQKARALVSPTASREGLDLQHQFASIMQEAIFQFDFFSHNIPDVDAALRRSGLKQDRELKILEIGSWEGLSSMFWLWLYPHSQLTAVDTWEGGEEHSSDIAQSLKLSTPELREVESRFDKNTEGFHQRLLKKKMLSGDFFRQKANNLYDIIYVDGSHKSGDVLSDAWGSFDLLSTGGLLIFDDYQWRFYENLRDNPAAGVNAFLRAEKRNRWRLLHVGYQLILQKVR